MSREDNTIAAAGPWAGSTEGAGSASPAAASTAPTATAATTAAATAGGGGQAAEDRSAGLEAFIHAHWT